MSAGSEGVACLPCRVGSVQPRTDWQRTVRSEADRVSGLRKGGDHSSVSSGNFPPQAHEAGHFGAAAAFARCTETSTHSCRHHRHHHHDGGVFIQVTSPTLPVRRETVGGPARTLPATCNLHQHRRSRWQSYRCSCRCRSVCASRECVALLLASPLQHSLQQRLQQHSRRESACVSLTD